MTPCQKLVKQEGTAKRTESMQQSSATPSYIFGFWGLRKIVACSQSSSQCLFIDPNLAISYTSYSTEVRFQDSDVFFINCNACWFLDSVTTITFHIRSHITANASAVELIGNARSGTCTRIEPPTFCLKNPNAIHPKSHGTTPSRPASAERSSPGVYNQNPGFRDGQ